MGTQHGLSLYTLIVFDTHALTLYMQNPRWG